MGRRGNPADAQASHCIAQASYTTRRTGLPRLNGLAMTALGNTSENWNEPPRPFASLGGRPSTFCHCEMGQSPDAAIQRTLGHFAASTGHLTRRS